MTNNLDVQMKGLNLAGDVPQTPGSSLKINAFLAFHKVQQVIVNKTPFEVFIYVGRRPVMVVTLVYRGK